MLRLSVPPLPKMNRELTSHDPWDCCSFLACAMCYQVQYVLCVMRYVLRGSVVRDAWCVVVRFHALLRPLNCGPWATYLLEFSMVFAVHIIHINIPGTRCVLCVIRYMLPGTWYLVPVCVTWYVLCVAWCGGAWCVVRGDPFSCASSPAELWPSSNLTGRVFDDVSCAHTSYRT